MRRSRTWPGQWGDLPPRPPTDRVGLAWWPMASTQLELPLGNLSLVPEQLAPVPMDELCSALGFNSPGRVCH